MAVLRASEARPSAPKSDDREVSDRRATIAKSVTPIKGVMSLGPTKGHERRDVPIPRLLDADPGAYGGQKGTGHAGVQRCPWSAHAVADVPAR